MFIATERRDWRQFGRILVGIGLLVLSLEMIGQASEPLRDSKLLPVIVNYFSGDPVTAYLLAALITWLFHSSIAAVLLMVTLAGRGLIPPELGIVLVLGVNLGTSIIAPLLTRCVEPGRARRADRQPPDARRRLAGHADPVPVRSSRRSPFSARRAATRSSTPISCSMPDPARRPAAGRLVYRASEKIVALGTKPEPAERSTWSSSARSTRARSTCRARRWPTPPARWCGSARPSRSC